MKQNNNIKTNNELLMSNFNKNLDDLLNIFKTKKFSIVYYVHNNFKENIHFIRIKSYNIHIGSGGHNKITYLLTEETFELVKNTYNLKHRYLTKINENCKHINLLMSLENQTIGFIDNCFKNVIETKRQKKIGSYKVDLYFNEYNLIVECDEKNHSDRNVDYENKRTEFLLSKCNNIIRYNPNHENFDLSFVIKEINKILLLKNNDDKFIVINVNFKP